MHSPALELSGIGHSYGDGVSAARALDRVDLRFSGGELAAVMGPSGSGKSTLLSILGCLTTPTQGTVRVAEEDVTHLAEGYRTAIRRKHIGFIFQSFRLLLGLTALDNVGMALEIRGVSRSLARRAAADGLGSVGLGDKLHCFPHELSGGQKQRVAIARALVSDPGIILADEPTASLDAESGHDIAQLLRRLATEKQRAVLVVTHDSRVLPFADRIVTLERGRVVNDRIQDIKERTN